MKCFISGFEEERECNVGFCPPSCPKFDILFPRPDDRLNEGAQMMVDFTLEKSIPYFGKAASQDLKLKPIADNTIGVDLYISKDPNQQNESIVKGTIRGLKRDHTYVPEITIHSTVTVKNQSSYIDVTRLSLNCTGSQFTLTFWNCSDGSNISSTAVCDGHKDCQDGSDEWLSLCHGIGPNRKYVLLTIVCYVLLGFLAFLPGEKAKFSTI